jgi:hypothetical protein
MHVVVLFLVNYTNQNTGSLLSLMEVVQNIDIKSLQIDCLTFVMYPILTPVFQSFFFWWSLIVLMKETRQAVRTILLYYLDVYGTGSQVFLLIWMS